MNENRALSIVTVGHVDHGKSTVIGRLLADGGGLPEGKLEAIRENCRKNARPFEYAFLLDALKSERSQGITIDTARCFFSSKERDYIIIDAPGHIEFLKNMVTGASRAEAAIMIIDASRGVEENTRRHGYFLSMLGIRQVAVLVNKMDLVGYSRDVFEETKQDFSEFLGKIGIVPASFIPVSGIEGDNIIFPSKVMGWYDGPTLLEQMDAFAPVPAPEKKSFRMPVQGVYKFTEMGDDRRIVAGTVEAGTVRAGDELVFLPSGKRTAVRSLEVFNAPAPEAFAAGCAAGFTMTEEIFVRRGEIACRRDEPLPCVGVRLRANVFWLGKTPFDSSRTYSFKCGTAKVGMTLERILRTVNASTLLGEERAVCEKNEVCECILRLDSPVAFELAGTADVVCRFVIVDGYEISGGGTITEVLEDEDYDRRNIRWNAGAVTEEERCRMTGRRGMVVWLTGLSGAGKSTIAQEAERRLIQRGVGAYVLDGDRLRRGICADLGFTEADRRENMRRVGEIAELFRQAGIITFVTLISPYKAGREQARACVSRDFMEVYVKAGVETCMARDPKGLYKKAGSGGIADFTGLTSPYEVPENPELVLDTETMDEDSCVERLLEAVDKALEDRLL